MVKFILAALVAVSSFAAQAASYYSVNGKLVSQGQAEEMIRKDPKLVVIKIQATRVTLNEQTGNFKKLADISTEELKQAVK